jgi:hypothetical protein
MKKIETDTVQREDLNFDNMSLGDYEKSTGVTLPEVQDQALKNVALVAPQSAKDNVNWAIQQMAEVKPKDAVESMLAQQMIALNSLMMKSCDSALQPYQTIAGWDMHLKHAARLSNAFTNVSTALDKHRCKGQQTIVVKHQQVNVGSGGQAVIGHVKHYGGGE